MTFYAIRTIDAENRQYLRVNQGGTALVFEAPTLFTTRYRADLTIGRRMNALKLAGKECRSLEIVEVEI